MKNKAYAGWTMNVSSVLLLSGPVGDISDGGQTQSLLTEVKREDLKQKNRERLRF
jgi:hypothetical protein